MDSHFNSKIVFDNLENLVRDLGYTIRRVETRENGRGTPLATRATTNARGEIDFDLQVTVRLSAHKDSKFNRKIVLERLEQKLEKRGVVIEGCETREDGPGTPVAIRVRL